jgi:fatty-acyl-CoA synthase
VIVPRKGKSPSNDSILAFLGRRLPKWQLPDNIVRVAEIPHTATGKILKTKLRELFRNHPLPTA